MKSASGEGGAGIVIDSSLVLSVTCQVYFPPRRNGAGGVHDVVRIGGLAATCRKVASNTPTDDWAPDGAVQRNVGRSVSTISPLGSMTLNASECDGPRSEDWRLRRTAI